MLAILILTLPTQPNAVRVRVWRALKTLGCGALRDGAYLLPSEHAALFEPLAAEVREHGGSAMVLSLSPQADPYATVVYTLEARKREGTYEGNLAGNAVIIHKVERSGTAYSIDADVPPANRSNNEGSMFKPGEAWSTPDGRHHLRVLSATGAGFVVRIGPRPRVMSAPMPARACCAKSMRCRRPSWRSARRTRC